MRVTFSRHPHVMRVRTWAMVSIRNKSYACSWRSDYYISVYFSLSIAFYYGADLFALFLQLLAIERHLQQNRPLHGSNCMHTSKSKRTQVRIYNSLHVSISIPPSYDDVVLLLRVILCECKAVVDHFLVTM